MRSSKKLRADYLELLAQYGLQPPECYNPKHTQEEDEELRALNALGGLVFQKLPVKPAPLQQAGNSVYRDHTLLQACNERILSWISQSGLAPDSFGNEAHVGEFPTGSVNAEARKTANGYLVLVNSGLVYFVRQVFEAMVAPDEGHQRELALALPTLAYLLRRDPVYMPLASEEIDGVHIELLVNACCDFVVAHEFGHILCGHLAGNDSSSVRMLPTEVGDLTVARKSWEQEYQADEFAYNLTTSGKKHLSEEMIARAMQMTSIPATAADWLTYLRVSGVMAAFAAPFLFFTIEELLIETAATLRNIQLTAALNSTHPSTKLRQDNLKSKLNAQNNYFLSPNNYFLSWVFGLQQLIGPTLVQAKTIARDHKLPRHLSG